MSVVARPAPLRRAAAVAGWSMLVLGVGHTLTFIATSGQHDAATRRALAGLEEVAVAMPGLRHTLADLFTGYSLMMALLLATAGVFLLLMARCAEQAPGLLTSALTTTVVFAGVGLVLSWMLLPFPPLVGLSVALVAGVSGLIASRRPPASLTAD